MIELILTNACKIIQTLLSNLNKLINFRVRVENKANIYSYQVNNIASQTKLAQRYYQNSQIKHNNEISRKYSINSPGQVKKKNFQDIINKYNGGQHNTPSNSAISGPNYRKPDNFGNKNSSHQSSHQSSIHGSEKHYRIKGPQTTNVQTQKPLVNQRNGKPFSGPRPDIISKSGIKTRTQGRMSNIKTTSNIYNKKQSKPRFAQKGKFTAHGNGNYKRRTSGLSASNKSTPRYVHQKKDPKTPVGVKSYSKQLLERSLNRSGNSRSGALNASKGSRNGPKRRKKQSNQSQSARNKQKVLRKNPQAVKSQTKNANSKSSQKKIIKKNQSKPAGNGRKTSEFKASSRMVARKSSQNPIAVPVQVQAKAMTPKLQHNSRTNVSSSGNHIPSMNTLQSVPKVVPNRVKASPALPVTNSKRTHTKKKKLDTSAPKEEYPRKRNFSPIATANINKNAQKLFEPKNMKAADSKEENDSLGGGSKINVKNGSLMNFGGGSRMADNMSVMSRYHF